jgi:hypothetical protein
MPVTEVQRIEGAAPIALYRLYSADGALLWVGITHSLRERLAKHAEDKPWWAEVAHKTVAWCSSQREAERAEADAIRTEEPRYNIRHKPVPKPVRQSKRPLTGAERQRDWRERHARRTVELERAYDSIKAENAELRKQLTALKAVLADALADNERLTKPQCRHPAEAVDGGTCRACGTDLW